MDCPLLYSVLLRLFAFHRPHHHSQGTRPVLFNSNEFQAWKWKQNEMIPNKNDAFISSLTTCFWFPSVFFFFVTFQWTWYRFYQFITDIVVCWWEREMEKSNMMMDVFCVSSFFCLHSLDRVEWVLCLISMIHSMTLFLFHQCCCLLMWRERKKEWIVDGCLSCVFFLLSSQLR